MRGREPRAEIFATRFFAKVSEKLSVEKRTKDRLTILKMGLMNDIFNQKVEVNP